jgi:hypothetical protein
LGFLVLKNIPKLGFLVLKNIPKLGFLVWNIHRNGIFGMKYKPKLGFLVWIIYHLATLVCWKICFLSFLQQRKNWARSRFRDQSADMRITRQTFLMHTPTDWQHFSMIEKVTSGLPDGIFSNQKSQFGYYL